MTCLANPTDSTGRPLFDLVRTAIATVLELPADGLAADTRLVDDIDVDSLAMIEIVEIVEEQLLESGSVVRIADELLAQMQTLGDVVTAFGSAFATASRPGTSL